MENIYLAKMRNRSLGTADFRRASDALARILAAETLAKLPQNGQNTMLVPILRSGMALLPAFTKKSDAPVGFLGLERDETTAAARAYYQKFPPTRSDIAVLLDPMLATGGSAEMAVEALRKAGYAPNDIYFTGVLAAQAGYARLARVIPAENITLAAIDPELDAKKYIVPGLGDYGDRYFGTV